MGTLVAPMPVDPKGMACPIPARLLKRRKANTLFLGLFVTTLAVLPTSMIYEPDGVFGRDTIPNLRASPRLCHVPVIQK
jgi:hypothetical protein